MWDILLVTDNYSEQPEQSEQSSDYNQYISPKSDNNSNISNRASQNNSFSNSNNLLFTPTRTGRRTKILAPKQMLQRWHLDK